MQVTDFVNNEDLLLGRLVEDADGHTTYIDMEDGAEHEVKHVTCIGGETLIITWNGYAFAH